MDRAMKYSGLEVGRECPLSGGRLSLGELLVEDPPLFFFVACTWMLL